MTANCVRFNALPDRFESDVFQYLCQQLRQADDYFTVTGPFWVSDGRGGRQREIDGLIITPTCLFTLEAKNVSGRVVKDGPNAPLVVHTPSGEKVDFKDRDKDPYQQADGQWKALSHFLKDIFHVNIWVKSLVVFPEGSVIEAPATLRDAAQQYAPVFLLSLEEVADFVQTFRPPGGVELGRPSQEVLVKTLGKGVGSLTQIEKNLVANGRPLRQAKRQPLWPQKREKMSSPDDDRDKRPRPYARLFVSLLLAGIAYYPLSIWLPQIVSVGAAAVIFYLLFSRNVFLAGYTFVGSLTAGFFQVVLGATLLAALFAGVVWPFSVPAAWYLQSSGQTLQDLSALFGEQAGDVLETPPPATPALEPQATPASGQNEPVIRQTAVPIAPTPPENTPPTATAVSPTVTPEASSANQVRVTANSNVRAGPGTDFDIVTIVMKDETYPLLAKSDDKNWYQIQLAPGETGWIGSTRANLETGP